MICLKLCFFRRRITRKGHKQIALLAFCTISQNHNFSLVNDLLSVEQLTKFDNLKGHFFAFIRIETLVQIPFMTV